MGVMDSMPNATAEQKRAALAAMAQAGQSGVEAYQQGLNSVNADQAKAVDTVTNRGSWLGNAAQGELAGIVSTAGDTARRALDSQMTQYKADNAARTAATGGYFDQVAASVPSIKAWGDSQAQLAGKQDELKYRDQLQQQQMALDEHNFRMEQMRASAAAAKAAAAAKDDYTTAQKLKISQAMTALQQRNQQQGDLQTQVDSYQAPISRANQAQLATPNEMSSDERKYLSANAAEHASEATMAARVNVLPSVAWSDLYDKSNAQPVQSNGGEGMLGAQAAQAAQIDNSQSDGLAQIRAALERLMNQRSVPQTQLGILQDDTQKWQSNYQQAADMYGDPAMGLLAAGDLTDPNKLYSDKMGADQTQSQFGNYLTTGYKTPQDMLSAQNAQDALQNATVDPATLQLAKQLNMTPQMVDQVQQTEAYQRASQKAANIVADAVAGKGPLPTENMVRQELIQSAAEDPSLIQMIPIVLAEMKQQGVLTSDTYSQNNAP